MKISAQDEYGLRILLQIARASQEEGLNLSQLSELEKISQPYAAKITRTLRLGGLIKSIRGYKGGYVLARQPKEITINEALKTLGGLMYDAKFCAQYTGENQFCTNSVDCSLRSLWTIVQSNLDKVLNQITIHDLMNKEEQVNQKLQRLTNTLS